jgi:hypothetical protein
MADTAVGIEIPDRMLAVSDEVVEWSDASLSA